MHIFIFQGRIHILRVKVIISIFFINQDFAPKENVSLLICKQLLSLPRHVASNFRVSLKYLEVLETNDMLSGTVTWHIDR